MLTPARTTFARWSPRRGHTPTDTTLTPENVNTFRGIFLQLTRDAEEAHNALDVFLGDPERYPDPTALAAEADPAGDLEILAK